MIKLCPRNYLEDIYPCAKFHCNIFTGSFPPNMWNITLLWRTPGRILTIYGLNDALSPKDVPFRGLDDDQNP